MSTRSIAGLFVPCVAGAVAVDVTPVVRLPGVRRDDHRDAMRAEPPWADDEYRPAVTPAVTQRSGVQPGWPAAHAKPDGPRGARRDPGDAPAAERRVRSPWPDPHHLDAQVANRRPEVEHRGLARSRAPLAEGRLDGLVGGRCRNRSRVNHTDDDARGRKAHRDQRARPVHAVHGGRRR